MIEKKQLLDILIKEGYPEFMHEKTILKIQNFNEQISMVFKKWVVDNITPQITIEGYSFEYLVHTMKMQPVGAFITLDWLVREPEKAKQALRQGIK